MMNQDKISSQMRKGIVEFCFLLILSEGKAYPSELISRLEESGLSLKEATVYTILNRLKKEGKIDYEWQESVKGPPRKYFSLTASGIQALREAAGAWNEIENTINVLRKKYKAQQINNDTDN